MDVDALSARKGSGRFGTLHPKAVSARQLINVSTFMQVGVEIFDVDVILSHGS